MVDYESFGQYADYRPRNGHLKQGSSGQECGCSYCQSNAAFCDTYRTRFDDWENAGTTAEWEDEQYLLCPPRVLGYVLKDKQWAQLALSSLKPLPSEEGKGAWDKLKLADDKRGDLCPMNHYV